MFGRYHKSLSISVTMALIRCKLFGHKYPWSAHETKSEENKAAQYICQRSWCRKVVTRNPDKALFTPTDTDKEIDEDE